MTIDEKADAYKYALLEVRRICREAKDEEAALRRIDQIVGMAFKRAGEEEAGPELVKDEEERQYILNLGPLQMEGCVNERGEACDTRLWLNGTQVDAQGVDVRIRGDGPVMVDLVGVVCHEPR